MAFWQYQSSFAWADTRGYLTDQSRLWLNALYKTVITEGEGPVQIGGDIGGTPTTPLVIGLRGKSVSATGPANNQVLTWSSTNNDWEPKTPTTGTVTSVGLSAPAEFTVTGSPVTTNGVLTLAKVAQVANVIYAGPPSGGSVAPTFRTQVAADVPQIIKVNGVLRG